MSLNISIFGNCQIVGLMRIISALSSEVSVETYPIQQLPKISEIINKDTNIVFIQGINSSEVLNHSNQIKKPVYSYPTVFFSGFHPDHIMLPAIDQDRQIIPWKFHSHSAISVWTYINGISIKDAKKYYTENVFNILKFKNNYDDAIKTQTKYFREYELNFPLLFDKWRQNGSFMHMTIHPKLIIFHDIALHILKMIGISPKTRVDYLSHVVDPLTSLTGWPVYPEWGKQIDIPGDFTFRIFEDKFIGLMDLDAYLEYAYGRYSKFPENLLSSTIEKHQNFKNLTPLNSVISLSSTKSCSYFEKKSVNSLNPYSNLSSAHFWKQSIEHIPAADVDPVLNPGLEIISSTRVATAGSCFAQHIAKRLKENGFNYYVEETAPAGMSKEESEEKNYAVFSARYGNLYTARQLYQLFLRAFDQFEPVDSYWKIRGGGFADPFRPRIEPSGFSSIEELESNRKTHLSKVCSMFKNLDLFVFTLGLTEGWRSKIDGAVFPLAPGVAAGEMDYERYEFINFSVFDVIYDLKSFVNKLSSVNHNAKILFTVSPVPLIATYENKHVLTSTVYSKSVLRVAAEEVSHTYPHVHYFPSYEIITGHYNKGAYFESDLRSVNKEGVDHVMRIFMANYAKHEISTVDDRITKPIEKSETAPSNSTKNNTIVCDEEEILRLINKPLDL